MFCNQCGTAIPAGSAACPSCGRPLPQAAMKSRLESHLTLLSVFWYIVAILTALPAVVLFAIGTIAGGAVLGHDVPPPIRLFGPLIFYCIAAFIVVIALLSFFVAWGLQQRKPWARTLGIVAGILSLIHMPLGTALGIYTLVVLMPADAAAEYERLSNQSAMYPRTA